MGQFEKGNTAARGKRKTPEQLLFEHRCREYLEKAGFTDIVAMAKSQVKTDKKWALEVMLDRGFGRAETRIDAEISHQGAASSSPIELAGEITSIVPEAIDGGAGKDSSSGSPVEPGENQVVLPESSPEAIH